MAELQAEFERASDAVKNHDINDTDALLLYGLFKQAHIGRCNTKRPSLFDAVARAKWDAWNAQRHLSRKQAMEEYIQHATELIRRTTTSSQHQKHGFGPTVSQMAAPSAPSVEDMKDILYWASAGDGEGLKKMLNKFGSTSDVVDKRGDEGVTALMLAADRGDVKTVKILLEHNADVHAVDSDTQGALHYACASEARGVAVLLLSYGADPNQKDSEGQTARDVAPSSIAENWKAIVAEAVQANLERSSSDRRGFSDSTRALVGGAVLIIGVAVLVAYGRRWYSTKK